MPFEGLSSSPSQNRAPTERRRVPRAKILSDQEKQIIHDARQELKSRQDPEYRRELAEMEQYRGFSATKNHATETGSKVDFDALDRAYQIQDGPGMRRIARENRAEVGTSLRDTMRAHEDFMKEQDALDARESAYGDLRAQRIIDESNREANDGARHYRNEMVSRYGYEPTKQAERDLMEAYEAPMANPFDAGSHDFSPAPSPLSDHPDRAPFGFHSEDELGADDILDFPNPVDRRPETVRLDSSNLEEYIPATPPPLPPGAERRKRVDTALNRLNAEINRLDRGDFRHEQESVVLAPELQQDVRAMNIAALEANKRQLLADARAITARADARVDAVGAEFLQATGVNIESYLAGTASFADRARIMMKNVGAALKAPLNFLKGIFGPRPAEDITPPAVSPQALLERYEEARTAATEEHARLAGAEADAKRIQDQIDKLTLSPEALRAKDDAAWDRAERAQNAYTLARGNRGRVSAFIPRESSPVTPEPFVDDDEDVPEPPRSGEGYHGTTPRMNHRHGQIDALHEIPGIRKLAPLYAGPELSRTNGIKGAEAYDNVMDVPGFADHVNSITDEDMDSFLAEAPAPISPEAAPWRETSSRGSEAPSFIETLETVANAVSRDHREGLKIADRAYELLENDSDTENARRAHERFAIMGKYAKHLDQIVKTMVQDHGSISEHDVMQIARDTSPHGLRILNQYLTEALKKVGRERSIPSINEADDEQLAEITLLVRTLLQAKAEIAPALPPVSSTSTFDRGTGQDDEPELDLGGFEPIDLDDEDER